MPASIPASREEFDLEAGVIVLATGFRPYQPRPGEYGYQEFLKWSPCRNSSPGG